MMALEAHISRAQLSQAANLFGVTQPRISNLVHGKIDLFALDALVDMATAAGMRRDFCFAGRSATGSRSAPSSMLIASRSSLIDSSSRFR